MANPQEVLWLLQAQSGDRGALDRLLQEYAFLVPTRRLERGRLPAHIAAAFGVPVVVLFGSSNPVTWAPWRTEGRVLVSPAGIDAIEVDEVISNLKVSA